MSVNGERHVSDNEPRDIRRHVALASRILATQGHGDFIWGHCSIRDPAGRGVWIKRSNCGMNEVTEDLVHLVDLDGNVVEGEGKRHLEYPIHTEVMAARPDVGAVVHSHAPHSVALGAAGVPLRPVSHAATFFVPPALPRFTETSDLIVTPELGQSVARCLADHHALMLVNHGIVAVGPDIKTATACAVLLEEACRQQLRTSGFSGWATWSGDRDALTWTDEEAAVSKRAHVYPPTAVEALWDFLVRQVTTTPAPVNADGAVLSSGAAGVA